MEHFTKVKLRSAAGIWLGHDIRSEYYCAEYQLISFIHNIFFFLWICRYLLGILDTDWDLESGGKVYIIKIKGLEIWQKETFPGWPGFDNGI